MYNIASFTPRNAPPTTLLMPFWRASICFATLLFRNANRKRSHNNI